jgi:moderate conductance mechanosensitive channel
MDDNSEKLDVWESVGQWVGDHWWMILLILAGAYVARHFANVIVAAVIRRTVTRRTHGDLNEDDIKKRQNTLISLLTAVLRVLVWLVAIFTILGLFDLDLTPLLAGASVLGVALGFGAQSIIKDFLSGLFIILENQYRVGDVVELSGASGKVEEITIRSTVVRDNDGSVHYIPNGSITHTINRTMGNARLNLILSVAPNTDVDRLTEVVNKVGEKMAEDEKWKQKLLEPPRFHSITNFNNSVMEVKIAGKMQSSAQWSVTDELRKRLATTLAKEGVGLTVASETSKKKK